MESDRADRKLWAILAADVAGYSRLMGANDEETLRSLSGHRRELFDPSIAGHRGRIVKTTGDGLLAEFASAVDAVRCAVEVQAGMAERNADIGNDRRLEFRIGINVGDIVEQDGDIFGDGVNIAARLEGIAEPGGICVSERVQEDAAGKIGLTFEDIGEQTLKNIARPIHAYRLRPEGAVLSSTLHSEPSLPDKPSIAVLPFQNMSGDAEQDYFADGMVEEIITALSRTRWLFVIARNSSFTYKGRAVDVKQVGRELGVRYVLEGSVRKAGSRVRITGQLIDASTGAHLWADRFDGGLDDIFDLQDQVTSSVVGAIAPKLEQAEIERAKRKPTESLDAYDYFLRGMAAFHQYSKDLNGEALPLFYQAIKLDPNFASAYGMAARCYSQRKGGGWATNRAQDIAETARLARRAGVLGWDDAFALCTAGIALAFVSGDVEDGAAFIDRALELNPNLNWAWLFSGWVKVWLGEPEVAIEREARAMRLSPQDPHLFHMQTATAAAHFFAGRYAEALSWAEKSMREQRNFILILSTSIAAAAAALAGRQPDAESAMARVRQIDPTLRISNLKDFYPLRRADDFNRLAEGLRKAGLPE
jgi:TolB-like protein/class 3 adenylate cyclase